MGVEGEKKRIGNYICSDKSWPIIVDLQRKEDLEEVKDFFKVGENVFLSASTFCDQDEVFKTEELYNAVANNKGVTFITGLSVFLKLQGADEVKRVLRDLVQKSITGHIVILTYQCEDYMDFKDPRIFESGRIIISYNEKDIIPEIFFISPELANAFPNCYKGFPAIAKAVEEGKTDKVYISTKVQKKTFGNSVLSIRQLDNGYSILCDRDSRTKNVPEHYGTFDQWNYALQEMGKNGDWSTITTDYFASSHNLSQCVISYTSYSENKKWLLFVALAIFGVMDDDYLKLAVDNTTSYANLVKSIFRTILKIDKDADNFRKMYILRKNLIKSLPDTTSEAVDFCKVLSTKEKDAIYYLTDATQSEREKVISWLDLYGNEFSLAEIKDILSWVYPDLFDYLTNYRFKNDLLDSYFLQYKHQKLINKVFPEFEELVEEQSHSLGFVTALQPRTSLVDKIDVSNSRAYFVDAMGVEYLGFIQAKCNQYDLSANIICGKSELPTLTCFNKDFVETLKSKNCPISDIKDLDEIKHHGENNFDFEKVKIPLYLISELQIIDDLLIKIRASINSGNYKKAIIISDHGASRLAVLHNKENIWSMSTNGVHSGRCCPKNEIDFKPESAIEAEDFWVLANYDRFKGSRRANCEVHGGASLEEVAVPIIEITLKPKNIEAFIIETSKIITIGAGEYPIVKVYVSTSRSDVTIKVNDKFYDAKSGKDAFVYSIDLPEYTKKGIYNFDIFVGSDRVASNQTFEVKKKGMSENNLFG